MQGTKLPGKPARARLWIAGVSTAAILLGCEAQPVNEQSANGNQLSAPQYAEFKTAKKKEDRLRRAPLRPRQRSPRPSPKPMAKRRRSGLLRPPPRR